MSVLMFYKKPVAIDRNKHRDLRLKMVGRSHRFAARTNSIPLVTAEFPVACREYAIVFVTDENGGGVPIAITGLREDQNLFLGGGGQWEAEYIPAFVRRYPFLLQGDEASEQFGVLIDEEAEGLSAAEGERLFSEAGDNTPELSSMLEFLNQYRADATFTADFVRQLRKLDLLIPRVINATLANGETLSMNGFSVVDESRLNQLGDADLLPLVRSGHLASVYAHLLSLANVSRVLGRLERLEALPKQA